LKKAPSEIWMFGTNFEKKSKETTHQQSLQKKAIQEILRSPLRMKLSKLSRAEEGLEVQSGSKNTPSKIVHQASLISDQTPRLVSCVSHDIYNGNLKEYTWYQEKIFVHESLQYDLLMLQNVFEGKIISPHVYPLIFDHKSPQKEISLRSIQFYREVQSDTSLYHSLTPDEKGYFLIGMRDMFIAACRDMLTQDEKDILTDIVNLIDPKDSCIIYKTINNIDIAPYPTASHKMVRFIDEKAENTILDECFVRNELGLLIGFVDPRDLSFHNFENIVNLDSMFKTQEDFPITNFKADPLYEVYTFDLNDKSNTLLSLDKCGLYTQPINKLSRGGERFIFASKVFGNSLTNTLNKYISHDHLMNNQFRFVNYVFRYNKFKPGDRKFTSHFDTPYHDPTRRHYSKYTLILYLTPGTADPVLNIHKGKVKIDSIENTGLVKGVIFDQRYEHEGKSFIDSDKIFLRTELIYEYPKTKKINMNEEISRKFNIACYMTKQSVFQPELEKYASDCFNQVAQARIDLSKANLTNDVLIFKKYKGYSFITNGYDYWFLKNVSLKDAGIVAILDYFNCKYERNEPFNKLTFDSVVKLDHLDDVGQVFDCLRTHSQCKGKKLVNFKGEDLAESLQCDIDNQNFEEELSENENSEEEEKDEMVEEIYSEERDAIEEEKEEKKGSLKKNEKEEVSDDNEDYDEEEDEDEDDDDYYSDSSEARAKRRKRKDYCHFCDSCHPETRTPDSEELDEYIGEHNAETEIKLKEMKEEFTIFLFNKEIKIEKSKIKVTNKAILFGNEMPAVNFASCYGPYPDFEGHHTIQNIHIKGYSNIPPIHYKVYPDGYHLKIELFNNGFVHDSYKKLEKFSGDRE